MATRKKRKKELSFFFDHDDQEAKDLQYGEQKPDCKKYLKKDVVYEDGSIGGDWVPDED